MHMKFEGHFKKGRYDGHGVMTYNDGIEDKGKWKNKQIIKTNKQY